jgi:hypothetical protein
MVQVHDMDTIADTRNKYRVPCVRDSYRVRMIGRLVVDRNSARWALFFVYKAFEEASGMSFNTSSVA